MISEYVSSGVNSPPHYYYYCILKLKKLNSKKLKSESFGKYCYRFWRAFFRTRTPAPRRLPRLSHCRLFGMETPFTRSLHARAPTYSPTTRFRRQRRPSQGIHNEGLAGVAPKFALIEFTEDGPPKTALLLPSEAAPCLAGRANREASNSWGGSIFFVQFWSNKQTNK